jgi:hypothetical protein
MYSQSPKHVRSNFSPPIIENTQLQVYRDKKNMYSPSPNYLRSSFSSPVDRISPEIYLQVDYKDQESISSDLSSLSPCEERNEDAFVILKQIEENNNALGIQYNYEDNSSHDEDFVSCTSNISNTNEEIIPSPEITNAIFEDENIKVLNESITSLPLGENVSNNVQLAVPALENQHLNLLCKVMIIL